MKLNKKIFIILFFLLSLFVVFPSFAATGDYDLIPEEYEVLKNSSPEEWKDVYESYDYHAFIDYSLYNSNYYLVCSDEPFYYCKKYSSQWENYFLVANCDTATLQSIIFDSTHNSFEQVSVVSSPGTSKYFDRFGNDTYPATLLWADHDIYYATALDSLYNITSDKSEVFFQSPLEEVSSQMVGLLPVEEIVPTQVQEVIRQTLKTILPIAIAVFSALLVPFLIRWWAYHHQS